MSKISEIDLGSAVLSLIIFAGFIATVFVFIRLSIIGINYIKVNFSKEEKKETKRVETKGF